MSLIGEMLLTYFVLMLFAVVLMLALLQIIGLSEPEENSSQAENSIGN
jgi:hypothetical protein